MSPRALHALAATLAALCSACFQPALECSLCGPDDYCPAGLSCEKGMCVSPTEMGRKYCELTSPRDGGPGEEAGTQRDTASPGILPPPSPDGGAAPPATCTDRCCIGSSCLELGLRLQTGLLIWADRTSMAMPGFPLTRWRDRSPRGNDFLPVNRETPPKVQRDEVGSLVEIDDPGMVISTALAGTALDREDFTILVLARCDAPTVQGPVFIKQSSIRPRTGVAIYCNSYALEVMPQSPAPNRIFAKILHDELIPFPGGGIASRDTYGPGVLRLIGLRRVARTRLELRVDGAVQGETSIPEMVSLVDTLPAHVGSPPFVSPPAMTNFNGGLAAVVVVRGPLTDDEVAALEKFLMSTSGRGAPPL
jgi:hypothetical protein